MVYSKSEVMQYISEEDVKFIRLAFCDVFGNQKNISIMPDELERAFESGISIDASAVSGFEGKVFSDMFLFPDPSTLMLLPWRPDHGRVVRMFCDIKYPNGKIFELDGRSILREAVQTAMNEGFMFTFGSELKFYLFKTDEEGNPTKIPHDNAHYMDIAPMDKGENVRREICLTLERMGITPETSHHEEGPGQNEIDFKFYDPLTAADNAVTFGSVVRTIAARNGLYADFSPNPIPDMPVNSFHIHLAAHSIKGEKDIMPNVIAGLMNRVCDMTAFLNPVEDSYLRFGRNKVPKFIAWSAENRSQLIRVLAATGAYKRIELRSPDPSANPYICFALMIYAALEGIKNKEELNQPANVNLAEASREEQAKYKRLPESLNVAKELAANSEFVRRRLPEAMIASYCK